MGSETSASSTMSTEETTMPATETTSTMASTETSTMATTSAMETSAMSTIPPSETFTTSFMENTMPPRLAAVTVMGTLSVSLDVALDVAKNVTSIILSGPADVWFGIALNANSMSDLPYAIVVGGAGEEVGEWKLGNYAEGEKLDASLQQVSSAVVNGIRFVEFERPLVGKTSNHFSFDSSLTTLGVIASIGSTESYSYHKATAVGKLDFRA